MKIDNSCIFCKIVCKQAPASIVFEDGNVLAFMDIRPLNEGHTLVIPKEHYVDVLDVPQDLMGHVYKIVKPTSVAVKKAEKADGITIIQQNGKAAGQEVFHLHVHVIPRFKGQKLKPFDNVNEVERGKLEETAKEIRRYM